MEIKFDNLDNEKVALLTALSNQDSRVLSLALVYAQNMNWYGLDVTEKWETAVTQSKALQKAYLQGQHDEAIKYCKRTCSSPCSISCPVFKDGKVD